MKGGKHSSRVKRIIGDLLLVLAVLLTADVVIIMLHRINAVVLFSLVILFFCGKVAGGSVINTATQADHAIMLGMALENGNPAPACWRGWTRPGRIWKSIRRRSSY